MSAALLLKAAPVRRPSILAMRGRAERQFANDLRGAFRALARAISVGRLSRALRFGIEAAMREVPVDEVFVPRLRALFGRTFRDLFEAAGDKAFRDLKQPVKKDRAFDFKIDESSFSVLDDRPLEWLRVSSATKVTQVSAETQAGIRAALAAGFESGESAAAIARTLPAQVGLLERWTKPGGAVPRFRQELREFGQLTNPTAMQRAMFPKLVGAEQDLPDNFIEYATRRYEKALLHYRTNNIARTEVQSAISNGQDQAYRQMQREGLVREDVKRIWVIAHDEVTCPICRPLDGLKAKIGEDFVPGIRMPPDPHASCRCDTRLDI